MNKRLVDLSSCVDAIFLGCGCGAAVNGVAVDGVAVGGVADGGVADGGSNGSELPTAFDGSAAGQLSFLVTALRKCKVARTWWLDL